MKRYFSWMLTLLLLFGVLQVSAQVKNIKGLVVSAKDKSPVIGASVIVKGTTKGAISDVTGTFTIKAEAKDVLSISAVGFKKQEVKVGNNTTLNVTLEEDTKLIDELVVVGYGTVKKQDLTTSISTVKGSEVKNFSSGNISNALQGKVAGVQIMNGSGAPGSTPKVLIRGISSFNGSDPLYVVDGVPMGNSLNFLNPSDVESIEVLKDASATAIYGTRASNGVVLISTKKGKESKITFNFDAYYGIQTLPKPELADGIEYAKVMNERKANAGETLPFSDLSTVKSGTDWWDEVIRPTSPMQNYNLGFAGGDKKTTYAGSIGYFKQESQMDKGKWEKVSARFNSEYKFNKYITFSQTFNPRYESWVNTPDVISNTLSMDPTTPVYIPVEERINNGVTDRSKPISWFARSVHNQSWNPAGIVYRAGNDQNKQYAMTTNSSLAIEPIPGLVFKSQLGLNLRFDEYRSYTPIFFIDNLEKNDKDQVSSTHNNAFDYVWNNFVTYTKTFASKHNVTAMAGYNMERYSYSNLYASRKDLPNSNELLRYLNAATGDKGVSGVDNASSLMSYLGRINYNYDNRYYLTASVRTDGSSKFSENNKWATFPSLSLAWRASSENFMKDISWISNLKLRAGWGRIGNQNISDGAYIDQLSSGYYVFGGDRSAVIATYPSTVSNKDLKWETVEDYNIGIDLGLLNDKLTITGEYYTKESKDMLMETKYPTYSGYPTWLSRIWANVGSIQVKGWEASVNYHDEYNGLKYDIGLNLTHAKSKALKLANGSEILDGGFQGGNITRTIEGSVLAGYYGYVVDGVFQNQTEINSHTSNTGNLLQPDAVPGDFRFKDLNKDGVLNDKDREYLGNPYPDVTVGLNIKLEYKNFDFTTFWYGSFGNENFNTTKYALMSGANNANVKKGLYDASWRIDNPTNSQPRLTSADKNSNFNRISSYYVEDASFVRCKNIQLGYTFNKGLFANNKLRVSLSAQNPFLFTKYSGLDPEVGGGILNAGIDWGTYPVARTYLVNMSLSF
ncbi:TonB-dependent receptor [uncultured Acetobacteroides sp.]|uniref:SusC/RagA family TonB-linked outer membrane protein n=1 Tax=uncultured Acetobacteroides sp. TaxID=1760811 RepID=UPI0029F56904|nr:TonB-dependent receptor [uncultured Acetobacteroides sp.]